MRAVVGAFRTLPATVLVVVTFAALLFPLLLTSEPARIPAAQHQHGLNLSAALADLRTIAAGPHPYNSHANDKVRAYILSRLTPLAAAYHHVHVVDDLVSNATWTEAGRATYFEGTNILVSVEGTDPDLGAVLFSAHYDSVSTASGATDDGMGVATLLQLVQLFANVRHRRTAVFNINNGEEDGLHGARVFLRHPLSNTTTTFLNLEGASSGGRPLLFRSTSTKPLHAFSAHVPHPHANVLASDAFSLGLVRSATDFSVYMPTMQGIDLAFYKRRSSYHTPRDALPYVDGGPRALWAMLETAAAAGEALLDADDGDQAVPPVYFDLFGSSMVLFKLATLRAFSIAFLVILPLLAGLWVFLGQGRPWGWVAFRFWFGVILSVAAQAALVVGYIYLNPYIIYSSPKIVVLSQLSLAYLTLVLPLTFSPAFLKSITLNNIGRQMPSNSEVAIQKQTVLSHYLLFTYILLLVCIILLSHVGGTYLISAASICAAMAWGVGVLESWKGRPVQWRHEPEGQGRLRMGVRFDHEDGRDEGHEIQTEPTEVTPLLLQQPSQDRGALPPTDALVVDGEDNEDEAVGWWAVQFLLGVPIPVMLTAHVGLLFLDSMSQTVGDGPSVAVVYVPLSFLAILLFLPLTPFASRIHPRVARLFAVIFVMGVVYTWGLGGGGLAASKLWGNANFGSAQVEDGFGFPFTETDPVKVYFQQKVEILTEAQPSEVERRHSGMGRAYRVAMGAHVRMSTKLVGVPGYLENMIVPALPSALLANSVHCSGELAGRMAGLTGCSWDSGERMVPNPGNLDVTTQGVLYGPTPNTTVIPANPWFKGSITRTSKNTLRIVVLGTNTRACRVYFNETVVANHTVRGHVSNGRVGQGGMSGETHVDEIRLWSRTWGQEFVIDVELSGLPGDWEGNNNNGGIGQVRGQVACGWNKYESAGGSVGLGRDLGEIPALEEMFKFLPKWVTITKLEDSLVEVSSAWVV